MSEIKAKRVPLLTARQVAVAAVLGGLNFACTALGIAIPGYLPVVSYEFMGMFVTLAIMATGPWGGLIPLIANYLVSPIGLWGVPTTLPYFIVFTPLYKPVYRIKNTSLRVVALWIIICLGIAAENFSWAALYAYVFRLVPFWPQVIYIFTTQPIWLTIYALVPSIVLVTNPSFVEPTWAVFPRRTE